jgi:hypothetical protein
VRSKLEQDKHTNGENMEIKQTNDGILFISRKSRKSRKISEIKVAFGNTDHGENTEYFTDVKKFLLSYQEYLAEYPYVYCEIVVDDGYNIEYYEIQDKLPSLYQKMVGLGLPTSQGE